MPAGWAQLVAVVFVRADEHHRPPGLRDAPGRAGGRAGGCRRAGPGPGYLAAYALARHLVCSTRRRADRLRGHRRCHQRSRHCDSLRNQVSRTPEDFALDLLTFAGWLSGGPRAARPAPSPSPSSATSPRPASSPTSPGPQPRPRRHTTARNFSTRHHQLVPRRAQPAGRRGPAHDAASQGIAEALRYLDDTIRQIRDTAFTTCGPENLSRTTERCWVTPCRSLPETPGMPLMVPDRCRQERASTGLGRSLTDIAISLICEARGPARRASLARLPLYVTGDAGQPSAVPRPLSPNRRSP